jgi:hypothetical protein
MLETMIDKLLADPADPLRGTALAVLVSTPLWTTEGFSALSRRCRTATRSQRMFFLTRKHMKASMVRFSIEKAQFVLQPQPRPRLCYLAPQVEQVRL